MLKVFAVILLASQAHSLGSSCQNKELPRVKQSNFWLAAIKRQDEAPYHPNPSQYKVFRNVKDFGAKGDGKTDDTNAINMAIAQGSRCGLNCGGSTTAPAIVYFPPGQYLITGSLIQYYYTQFIGDPLNVPSLIMAPNFSGPQILIESDPKEHWSAPINFYRGIRHLIIDLTHAPNAAVGIRWDVAQATFLTSVHFKLSHDAGTKQIGLKLDQGSGGHMADLTFDGGDIAMSAGNQQFTARNITITKANVAIRVVWNWGWTFKGIHISNCLYGIDARNKRVGSIVVLDADITNTYTAFLTESAPTPVNPPATGTLILDNIRLNNVSYGVIHSSKQVLLEGTKDTKVIQQWGAGHVYDPSGSYKYQRDNLPPPSKAQILLDNNGNFFEKPKPVYDDVPLEDFVSVKDEGAKGDGKADDTAAIQQALDKWAGCKIIFFPAGYYVVSDTIQVPAGSRIIGEIWSTILVTGSKFADLHNPKVAFQIGKPGEEGLAEITELIFSNIGPIPGAIVVQINLKEPANDKGAVGLWDVHFRIGGATGTKQELCSQHQQRSECNGAFLMLHIAPTGSAYLENLWAWLADHHLDPRGVGQTSIYNGRGILSESANGPVWMYGTASEHSVLYQYQVSNSKNVFMGFIQTETPYFQSVPPAPKPFVSNSSFTDPDFSHCGDSKTCPLAYGLRIVSSENVYVYGSGLYNFFNDYSTSCQGNEGCQDVMVAVDKNNRNVHLFNLNTKSSTYMVAVDGQRRVAQKDNRSSFCSSVVAVSFP